MLSDSGIACNLMENIADLRGVTLPAQPRSKFAIHSSERAGLGYSILFPLLKFASCLSFGNLSVLNPSEGPPVRSFSIAPEQIVSCFLISNGFYQHDLDERAYSEALDGVHYHKLVLLGKRHHVEQRQYLPM